MRCRVGIGNAAGRQRQGQVPQPVFAFHPSIAVAVVLERERLRRLQREAGAARDLGHDGIQAMIVDGVLETRAFAHCTVAEVALRGDHRSGDIEQLIAGDKTNHVATRGQVCASPCEAPMPPPMLTL